MQKSILESDLVCWSFLHSHRGVLVPGGFGTRGTEGKILAINWARKQNKPFLGKKVVSYSDCLSRPTVKRLQRIKEIEKVNEEYLLQFCLYLGSKGERKKYRWVTGLSAAFHSLNNYAKTWKNLKKKMFWATSLVVDRQLSHAILWSIGFKGIKTYPQCVIFWGDLHPFEENHCQFRIKDTFLYTYMMTKCIESKWMLRY